MERTLLRGWEHTKSRFSWAGLSYMLPPSNGRFEYPIKLRLNRGAKIFPNQFGDMLIARSTVTYLLESDFLSNGPRITREKKSINAMVQIYCHNHHHPQNSDLCPECTTFLTYAYQRLDKCPFQRKTHMRKLLNPLLPAAHACKPKRSWGIPVPACFCITQLWRCIMRWTA